MVFRSKAHLSWPKRPERRNINATVLSSLRSAMPHIRHFAPLAGIKAPPLSFAARTGDLLFISGIPGFDETGTLPESFEAQFGNVVRNIKRVLEEAGATFRNLVKVNVLLTRASDVAPMNALRAAGRDLRHQPRCLVPLDHRGRAQPFDG